MIRNEKMYQNTLCTGTDDFIHDMREPQVSS